MTNVPILHADRHGRREQGHTEDDGYADMDRVAAHADVKGSHPSLERQFVGFDLRCCKGRDAVTYGPVDSPRDWDNGHAMDEYCDDETDPCRSEVHFEFLGGCGRDTGSIGQNGDKQRVCNSSCDD